MTQLYNGPQATGISRVITKPLILVIRIYQKTLSPILPSVCKYYPSCSKYAVTALTTHGPITGTRLMLWRIIRCNPWSAGGVDYVPEKIKG